MIPYQVLGFGSGGCGGGGSMDASLVNVTLAVSDSD